MKGLLFSQQIKKKKRNCVNIYLLILRDESSKIIETRVIY